MAERHGEDETAQDGPTTDDDAQDAPTEGVGRRSVMKALGATAALGSLGAFSGTVSAAPVDLSGGDTTIPAGEYEWDGSGLRNDPGESIVGEGGAGDVVLNMESGTMDGSIGGSLENIVVRGSNKDSKAGIDLQPGSTVDGFVWPEGGQQSEDRALYSPNGGSDRVTVRNSAWGWMVNNGAYLDKPPVTMENCAAVNNNIANIRVGHRDGTDENETTVVRNCLIAVTEPVLNDDTNVPNARGLRLRNPADLVVENCWFVYLDVDGTADLIELHDGAAGSTVEIRDCTFYNDSGGDLVRDKSGGRMDVTIENCAVAGSGSRAVEPDFDGSGFSEVSDPTIPLPSAITGYDAADEIDGVGDGIGPWDGSSSGTVDDSPELGHTLVLHAGATNEETVDVRFTVDGPVEYAGEAEPETDSIVDNGDGTTTVTSVLSPDELDSFRYDDDVVDYALPTDASIDVSLDGTTTTFDSLVAQSTEDVLEVIARQTGELNYQFVVDGEVDLHETSSKVTAGNGDSITQNDDGTVTVKGFTGNTGFGDAYLVRGIVESFSADPADYDFDVLVNGEVVDPDSFGSDSGSGTDDGSTDDGSSTDDSSTDDGSSTDGSTDDSSSTDDGSGDTAERPHLLTIDGDGGDVTNYTFTVSGSVVRDDSLSESTDEGTQWSRLEDFAQDGKVIGLVGGGVDAYRFGGNVTGLTVDGDASLDIQRNVR